MLCSHKFMKDGSGNCWKIKDFNAVRSEDLELLQYLS